jgi:hypothetical protein
VICVITEEQGESKILKWKQFKPDRREWDPKPWYVSCIW